MKSNFRKYSLITISFIFSFCVVLGINCKSLKLSELDILGQIFPKWSIWSYLLFGAIAVLSYYSLKYLINCNLNLCGENISKFKYSFITIFSVIGISYFIASLIFYPGNIFPDSIGSLQNILNGPEVALSNHHPIIFTALINLFIKLGGIIGLSLDKSIYLFTLFQITFVSLILAYAIDTLYKCGVNRIIVAFITLVFAFFPHFSVFSVTMWKDPLFSACLVLLSTLMFKLYINDKFERRNGYFLLLLIGVFGTLFFRNNGVYVIVLSLFTLVIFNKSKLKLTKLVITFSIVIYYLFTTFVYPYFNVEKVPVESFGIPMQQVAYSLKDNLNSFNEKDLAILDEIMPIEKWQNDYTPRIVDNLKWNPKFNEAAFNEHKCDFFRIYLTNFPNNIKQYVLSYLAITQGFYDPINQINHEYYASNFGIIDNEYGLVQRDLLNEKGIDLTGLYKSMPLVSSGLAFWIVMFSSVIYLFRQRNSRGLIIFIPYLGVWFTLMLATPLTFGARYGLVLFYGAVLLPVIAFINPEYTTMSIDEGHQMKLNHIRINEYIVFVIFVLSLLIILVKSRGELLLASYSEEYDEISLNNNYYYTQPIEVEENMNVTRISIRTYSNSDTVFDVYYSLSDAQGNVIFENSISSSTFAYSDDGNNWTDFPCNFQLEQDTIYTLSIHGNGSDDTVGLVGGQSYTSTLDPVNANYSLNNAYLNIKLIGS